MSMDLPKDRGVAPATGPVAGASSTEQVIVSTKCSHWHYAGRWALVLFLVVAGIASFFVDGSYFGHWALAVRAAPFLCAVCIFLLIQFDRGRRVYQVTNRRVVVEWGILAKSSNEIRVQDIRSINVSKSGISGMLGIGNVEFSSAATDDAEVVFVHVPGADKVRDAVRALKN
jgi:membrane protein YdbS with pleckstrin-like domain